MRCPNCDIPMNRHAEKPLKALPSDEYSDYDPVLGAVVVSIHCCPRCGKVEVDTESRE